jgi:hypothetical protein
LDLTVEAVVVEEPKWHSLFSKEELAKARKRFADYGISQKQFSDPIACNDTSILRSLFIVHNA